MKIAKLQNCKIGRGFTLIELVIVIGILGILSGVVIAVTNPATTQAKARDSRRRSDLTDAAQVLELYYADNGAYPVYGSPTPLVGIAELGVYLPVVPLDPSGGQYTYVSDATGSSYELNAVFEREDMNKDNGNDSGHYEIGSNLNIYCSACHLACSGMSCVAVAGEGANECSIDSNCYHRGCVRMSCVTVAGGGANECSIDSNCYHKACSGMSCVTVAGGGSDLCTVDANCYHKECNYTTRTCELVTGSGSDSCTTFSNCVHKECNPTTQTCVTVDSPGASTCSVPSDCYTRWSCNQTNWTCYQSPSGPYSSQAACQTACVAPIKYACNQTTYACYQSVSGIYTSLSTCQSACVPPPMGWACNQITWSCYEVAGGPYATLTLCKLVCKPSQPRE